MIEVWQDGHYEKKGTNEPIDSFTLAAANDDASFIHNIDIVWNILHHFVYDVLGSGARNREND
jgi:hypothetical protein